MSAKPTTALNLVSRARVDGMADVAEVTVGQLAARHGDEQPVVAVDHLYIAYHKASVQRDRGKRLQASLVNELNLHVGNLKSSHASPPSHHQRAKPDTAV